MYRIIGADGREYGPITAEQLRQWIAEGRANAQTKILLEGTTEWKTIGEFPEFAGAPVAAPGPVPGPTITTPLPPPPGMPSYTPAAAEQVNGPAIGLIILAILELLGQLASLGLHFVGTSLFSSHQMPSDTWGQLFSGTMGVVFAIIGMLISGIILLGAIKMKSLENYGLAMTASIVAMLPCSLCCIIGLPLGIWAIVVLSKPEVKSAFH